VLRYIVSSLPVAKFRTSTNDFFWFTSPPAPIFGTVSLAANSVDCESDASFEAAAVVKQVLCLLSAFA